MKTFDFTNLKQFITLSPQQEKEIHAVLQYKTIRKDGVIALQEHDMIAVEQGIFMKIHNETEDVSHFIAPQEIAIFPEKEHPYTLQALETGSIFFIRHLDVMSLLNRHPALNQAYHKMILLWSAKRVHRGNLLQLSAADAKAAFYQNFKHIAHSIPNKYIASYLNMTASYFSQL